MQQSTPEEKLKKLKALLKDMGKVILAYSGGVDSTFLLKVACDVLGGNAVAVTGISPSVPQEELKRARELARAFGARHIEIPTEELEDPRYAQNPPERCFYCKSELFTKLRQIAEKEGVPHIVDATNVDDQGDWRPGLEAAKKLQVRSPLVEAGMTKKDIRELSRRMGLPTWDLPAAACLASRFPYGETITEEKLKRVERSEAALKELGFRQVRVRSHQNLARIEVDPSEVPRLTESSVREKIIKALKEAGFTYVTVDLQGYRTGSQNEILPLVGKQQSGS